MREILFRGKHIDTGKWIVGLLPFKNRIREFVKQYNDKGEYFHDNIIEHVCEPETIGQFTGLLDKSGTKIFEGDIVRWKKADLRNQMELTAFVEYSFSGFCVYYLHDDERIFMGSLEMVQDRGCEIIGNIHDNPELLRKDV